MWEAPGPGGGCTLFVLRKPSRLLGRLPGERQGQVTPEVSGGREHPARPERVLKGPLLPQGSLLDEKDLYVIGQYAGALRFYRLHGGIIPDSALCGGGEKATSSRGRWSSAEGVPGWGGVQS